MDGHCKDTKVKSLAYWQAVGFHLLATEKEVQGAWITPSCLVVLGRKEYFAQKTQRYPKIIVSYGETIW